MKKLTLILLTALTALNAPAQEDEAAELRRVDSIEKSLTYTHGTVELKNKVGRIVIPQGFKYLDAAQSKKVLVDIWGNPDGPDLTQGMILPEDQGVLIDGGYVFNIQYSELGYIKDDDADEINYDDLLQQMRKDVDEENKQRVKDGYPALTLVGWASKPFYDKDRKILHWAKEIKSDNSTVNGLNYNVRILGRKGVLELNAISFMPNLPRVQQDIPKVLDIVQFSDGFKYKNFDPKIDQVAAWTIGGLVAGKILAKVGFLAIFLKFFKVIGLAVAAFFGKFWKKLRRKKEDPYQQTLPEAQSEDITETRSTSIPEEMR